MEKMLCSVLETVDNQKPFLFIFRHSNLSFLNSSISRWLLNTFLDLSTTTKKSRRTKSFFSPLRWSMQKDFNCLLYHSFSMYISSFFYLFSIFSNLLQLSSRYLLREVGSIYIIWVSSVFNLYALKPTMYWSDISKFIYGGKQAYNFLFQFLLAYIRNSNEKTHRYSFAYFVKYNTYL